MQDKTKCISKSLRAVIISELLEKYTRRSDRPYRSGLINVARYVIYDGGCSGGYMTKKDIVYPVNHPREIPNAGDKACASIKWHSLHISLDFSHKRLPVR